MTKSSDLYVLVRALSMQEKRHFKLFAQRYSGQASNYIKLFDALAAQSVFSDEKLKKKLGSGFPIKHLAFEKHRLRQLLDRCLRLYHHGKGVDVQLKEMLIDAELLHERSLYAHCRKALLRARKLANTYERFAFIPEITRMESRLFDLEGLGAVYAEELRALKKMQVINRYRALSNKVATLVASAHHIRKRQDLQAFEKLVRDPLMRDEKKADTFTARVYYFYIFSVYHEMKGDLKGAYRSRKRFVELIEKDPVQMEVHAKNYLSALNNLGISQLELKLYDELALTIKKIRQMPQRAGAGSGADIVVSAFVFSSILEMNGYIRTGNFEKGLAALPGIERQLQKFGPKIQPQFRVVIHNSIKYIYFGAGELRRSLQWSNRVLHESGEVRKDIQGMARIFDLILHYELANTEMLEHILRSTYRYLLKSERLFKVETIVLKYLRKAANLVSDREVLASFENLYRELLPLAKDRYEKKAFEEFDLPAWLRSKISAPSRGKSLQENTEKRLKNSLKALKIK